MHVCPCYPRAGVFFIIFFSLFSYYDSVTSPNYHKSVLPNGMWGKWMLDLCHQGNWNHFWPHLSSPLQANFFERGMKWNGSLPVNGTSNCGFAQWQSLSVSHRRPSGLCVYDGFRGFVVVKAANNTTDDDAALGEWFSRPRPAVRAIKMGSWVKLRCRNIYG